MTSAQARQPDAATPGSARTPSTALGAPAGGGGDGGGAAGELEAFFRALLADQCRLTGAVGGVIVLTPSAARRGGIAARFVASVDGAADPDGAALASGVLDARIERLAGEVVAGAETPEAGVHEAVSLARGGMYQNQATHRLIAAALVAEGRAEGAAVVLVPMSRRIEPGAAAQTLALASSRLEAYLWRQQALNESHQKVMLREALELLDAAQQGPSAPAMGALMCHELARRFGCTRVSIGLIKGDAVRLVAISGADQIDRRAAAVETLEAAMNECADQDIEIVFPPTAEMQADPAQRRVTRSHGRHSDKFGPCAMLSLPLRVEGDQVGVVLLERGSEDPFPAGSVPLLRLVAEFIGPALWTRRLADRGFWAVSRDRVLDLGEAIVGPRHTGAKLLGLLVLAIFVALAVVPIPGRVTAQAEIKAEVSRMVAPPFRGYLGAVHVKPGDEVKSGQVIAEMQTEDLLFEQAEAEARRSALRAEQDEARAKNDAGKVNSLDAQIRAADAQIELLADRVARATVRSPIDGRVARGDLEAFVGAFVEPGQGLLEIVQDERLAVIKVNERDIGRVREGQQGRIVLRALPGTEVGVTVVRVNPMAEAQEGGNVYLVEARVDEAASWLLPGMTGAAKLDDGWTTGLTQLVRPIADEARLRLWW